MDLIPSSPEDSGDDFTPKRPRTTKGTTVMIPKDILSKLGPTADRLNLSGTQLAEIVAAVTNHSGGDINDIALSKSTARRHRCASRSNQASSIKKDFNCDVGQVNFDGKLLPGLGGFGKVNRLAVILNQASVLQVQQTYKFSICSVPILQNNCNSLTISTYIIQIFNLLSSDSPEHF